MEAKQLFEQGDLAGAIQAVTAEVKARPTDATRRTFLFELLSFAGDLDRAERQLEAIGHLDAASEWPVQVYKNILHAERLRRRLFSDGLRPEFLLDPPPYAQLHLDAVNRLREGRPGEAQEVLGRAEAMRPAVQGDLNGQACDEIRDCDDLLAPFLEVIVLRDYVWLPWEQLKELEVAQPERPRDLLWLPARIVLVDGSQRRGYLPTLYCGSHEHTDDRVKLGRITDWKQTDDGPTVGVGLHTLLAGDDAVGLLDVRHVHSRPH
ncbi:MAG TPA: type VI secretion system accessory protein TagJ [Pirellulales bacterium]|nr:type VI secretion system accessory protein TagJ [Pirellulales bacterium]